MSLNSEEINLIINELEITDAIVQQIFQPDFSTLVITLYKSGEKTDLLISLAQEKSRICTTDKKFLKAAKQQRFVQFLKSRIIGSNVTEISQYGKNRIIKIALSIYNEDNQESIYLWIRLWGGNTNIIVTDSNMKILDLFYRRPGKDEVSGAIFKLPENSSKTEKSYTVRDYPSAEGRKRIFNNFIDNFYSSAETEKTAENLKDKLSAIMTKKLSVLKTSLERVKKELSVSENKEHFMEIGKLILSSRHLVKPKDKWLETENIFKNGEKISIELNENLRPEENAENYFKRYKKLKAAETNLTEEKENIQNRIKILTEQIESLEKSDSANYSATIEKLAISFDLTETGQKGNQANTQKDHIPGLQFVSGSYKILVGRTASENDALLRKYVRSNDYWLHARDYPGGYVFIKSIKGKSIPLETLIDGGNLAVWFSKGKNNHKGEVYYTMVKYLRRAKDAKKGTVLPTMEKNLSITLNNGILKRLLGKETLLL